MSDDRNRTINLSIWTVLYLFSVVTFGTAANAYFNGIVWWGDGGSETRRDVWLARCAVHRPLADCKEDMKAFTFENKIPHLRDR